MTPLSSWNQLRATVSGTSVLTPLSHFSEKLFYLLGVQFGTEGSSHLVTHLKEAQKIGKAILSPWSTLFAFWYRVLTTMNKFYSPWRTLSSFLKIWNMFYIYQEEFLKYKHWEFPALKGTSRLKKSSSMEWLRAQCRLRFVYLSIKSNFHKELFQMNSNQSYIQVAKLLPQTERGKTRECIVTYWFGAVTRSVGTEFVPHYASIDHLVNVDQSLHLGHLVCICSTFKSGYNWQCAIEKKYHFRHC